MSTTSIDETLLSAPPSATAEAASHLDVSRNRQRGTVVVSAKESFSQSSTTRPDAVHPGCGGMREITVLRFTNRGSMARPSTAGAGGAQRIRFIYRLDLSSLFRRLHDPIRGLASLDRETKRLVIIDVLRNSVVDLRARLRWKEGAERLDATLLLNKNGLVRVEAAPQVHGVPGKSVTP